MGIFAKSDVSNWDDEDPLSSAITDKLASFLCAQISVTHKVLYAEVLDMELSVVTLTESNSLAVYSILMDLKGELIAGSKNLAIQESAPLDYMMFNGELARVIGDAYGSELWIVGRVTEMTLSGETFRFDNPIGYIVGATRDRVTPLLREEQ